jgi:GH15 family glucan-1,4-alpha-glucosidase
MCLPRFDSAACFAAILGNEQNGCWRIAPADPCLKASHAYRQNTLILETEFETEHGAVRLIDCMPPRASRPDVLRIVEGIRGEVAMEMELVVRFDYGISVPWVQRKDGLSTMIAGPDALLLRTNVKTRGQDLSTIADFTIAAGERKFFVLSWYPSHEKPPEAIEVSSKLGFGLDQLRLMLDQKIWRAGPPSKEEVVITNTRHHQALSEAIKSIELVIEGLRTKISAEFVSADMRQALLELGTIIGTDISEDILSAIFSKFCVGK